MTEREKMAQIIAEHLCSQGRAHKTLYGAARRCYSRNNFAECEKVSECVDALIEAGYGDVKEAEHRAEVAEKAGRIIQRDMARVFDISNPRVCELIANIWDLAKKQAERELAEEG